MPFDYMGIAISAKQFDDLAQWEPVYRQHLREWGIDSSEAIGTLINVGSSEDLTNIVRSHPASDFFLPRQYRAAVKGISPHELVAVSPDYLLLLSREPRPRQTPAAWGCRM